MFSNSLKQQLHPHSPCYFPHLSAWASSDEFHLKNGIGEELHGAMNGNGHFQINRRPANRDKGLQSSGKLRHRVAGMD